METLNYEFQDQVFIGYDALRWINLICSKSCGRNQAIAKNTKFLEYPKPYIFILGVSTYSSNPKVVAVDIKI